MPGVELSVCFQKATCGSSSVIRILPNSHRVVPYPRPLVKALLRVIYLSCP
eukprot:COSAG01_NODE_3124_length_6550_cov_213.272981_5_plen_51_part_00